MSPAPDLAAAADQFNDPVLVRLCRQSTPWISKVSRVVSVFSAIDIYLHNAVEPLLGAGAGTGEL